MCVCFFSQLDSCVCVCVNCLQSCQQILQAKRSSSFFFTFCISIWHENTQNGEHEPWQLSQFRFHWLRCVLLLLLTACLLVSLALVAAATVSLFMFDLNFSFTLLLLLIACRLCPQIESNQQQQRPVLLNWRSFLLLLLWLLLFLTHCCQFAFVSHAVSAASVDGHLTITPEHTRIDHEHNLNVGPNTESHQYLYTFHRAQQTSEN